MVLNSPGSETSKSSKSLVQDVYRVFMLGGITNASPGANSLEVLPSPSRIIFPFITKLNKISES